MNPFDNQPDNGAEGFDLDLVLDDAFASRRVPVLSPSMVDVRRRARRRTNRTRATGLAAVACVSVGGVAVLANNHRPALRPAVGAERFGGVDEPCAPQTTVVSDLLVSTTTALQTTAPAETPPAKTPPATTALGFAAAATSTTAADLVTTTTTCLPQPPSGFRCIGDPTVTQDGWVYYDFCESVDNATVLTATAYAETTVPSTTQAVVSVGAGDYLTGIADQYCLSAEAIATYNGWPDGVDHVLVVGDEIVLPPSSYCSAPTIPASSPAGIATTIEIGGATDVTSIFATTTELLQTTTTGGT